MDFQTQQLSFGDFETDLAPEDQREVYKILYEQTDSVGKKVEFPWSGTESEQSASGEFLPEQHDSGENRWSGEPQFVRQLMAQQNDPYLQSMTSDPVNRTTVSGQFQIPNDFFYDDSKGDGCGLVSHDFYGRDQTKTRDQDERHQRGSKPYERRNKKKRPPEYYKKVEEEIQAEILAKEAPTGAPPGFTWARKQGYETGAPPGNPHIVPSSSQHEQLYQMPPQTLHTSSSQYGETFDQHGVPMGTSGAPINYNYGQNMMKNVSSTRDYNEGPQTAPSGVPPMYHVTSNVTDSMNLTQQFQREGQNFVSDDSSYKYSSYTQDTVSSHYSNQSTVCEKNAIDIKEMSQQVTDLRVSQNEARSTYPSESQQNSTQPCPTIPSNLGAQVQSTETPSHETQGLNSADKLSTHEGIENTTNYSNVHNIDKSDYNPDTTRDLDLDQYPALGGSTIQHPLVSSDALPHQTSPSSGNAPSSACETRSSSEVKPTSVQSLPSSSQTDISKPKTSSWAGLFRDVNPAKQGFVVTYGTPSDKVEEPKQTSAVSTTKSEPVVLVSPTEDPAGRLVGDALATYKISHNQVGLQMRGLINRGNWCYINATLQALVSCPPFYNLMKKIPAFSSVRKGQSSTPILDSIVEFVNEFTPCGRTGERGRKNGVELPLGSTFEPVNVYKMLQVMEASPSFKLGKQEDAEEFLSSILDGMHEEMAALIKLVTGKTDGPGANGFLQNDASVDESSEDADPDSWEQVGPKKKSVLTRKANFEKTPLADIFVGYTRSAVYKAMSKESATLQPFFTLQLDIQSEKVYTVKEALEGLVSKEAVRGYTCSKTKTEVDVVHRVTLEELPPVLILHLKCFVYDKDGGSQKLMKKIDYSIDLEITKDLLSNSAKSKLQVHQRCYKLFAVVYHHGKQSTGGHYTTAVFHPAINNWILIDDSTVKRVGVQQVMKFYSPRVPYLLYYRRIDMHQS